MTKENISGGRRSVDLDTIQNKELPGLYVINVPKAVKSYYKVGISEADLEKRVAQYILSYPFGFNIVGVLIFKDTDRFTKVRKAESEVIKHFRKNRVFNYKGMRTSEWIRIRNDKEVKELKNLLKDIAARDGAKLSWFADSHSINLAD